jgi:hypothetical protein
MSDVVGDWKRWHTLHSGVEWQENFFDHRIRTDAEWEEKFRYIRNNPIVKGLCARPADWPWQSLGTDDESRPLDAARFDRSVKREPALGARLHGQQAALEK